MENKDGKKLHKGIITTIVTGLSLGILSLGLYGLSLQYSDNQVTEKVSSSIVYEVDSFEDLKESFYDGSISATQLQNSLNEYLDFYPTFATDTLDETEQALALEEEKQRTLEEGHTKDSDKVDELLTAYLDGLFMQQNRLNKLVKLINPELSTIKEVSGESLKNDNLAIEGLNSPIADGVLEEMHNTPLYLHSEDGEFTVWVDYDEINTVYSDFFNDFHVNLTRLHRDVIRFGYARSDGEIDTTVIYNRLLLIDDIQDGDVSKDNYYWENERYQLAVLFTGYGEDSKPDWDDTRLNQMLKIANSTDDPDKYSEIAKDLMESITDEGKYGEDTLRIANQWMHKEFEEFSEHLENVVTTNTQTED